MSDTALRLKYQDAAGWADAVTAARDAGHALSCGNHPAGIWIGVCASGPDRTVNHVLLVWRVGGWPPHARISQAQYVAYLRTQDVGSLFG